jgi:hypothetical protein
MPATPSASGASRTPLIVGAVAALIVIAIGFLGYRALYGSGRHESEAAAEPQKASEPAAAAPEPVKEVAAPPAAAPTAEATPATTPDEQGKVAAPSPDALPGTPAVPPKAVRTAQPKAAPKAEATAAEAPPAPTPTPKAPARAAPQVAAAPAAPVQPDRWQMYADAMARCAREDFFKRFGCEQRTRMQYCDGFWGQVPQCPAAPTRDHGQ